LKQREVVILRVYEENSFLEISKILGISLNSAKVNFQHALKKLKILLDKK